jgi:hypothetical protein
VTPDFVIYHLYPQAPFQESDAGLLQVPDTGSKSWTTIASDLRTQVNTNLGAAGAGVEIVVTENNDVYSQPGKQSTSLVNGLYLADSVANLMQTEINGYMWWGLRNGSPTVNNAGQVLDGNMSPSLYGWRQFGDYGMLSSPSTLTGETTYTKAYPTYYMMKLLSHFARGGDTVVKATSSNSLLSMFAVRHTDGTLSLLVINKADPRTTSTPQSANFTLNGFNPVSPANVYSYGVTQDSAAQSGGSGAAVDVASSTMSISGSTFSASFASYSATVISLTPAVAPVFTASPVTVAVGVGTQTVFATTITGNPAPTYQWQKSTNGGTTWTNLSNDSTYSGVTTGLLLVNNVTLGMDGTLFHCVATNSAGSVTSYPATLMVFTPGAAHTAGDDFNGDGHADILWRNMTTGMLSLWLMNPDLTVRLYLDMSVISLDWQVAGTGDFNGDGQTDILWRNTKSGLVSLWLMNGTTVSSYIDIGVVSADWQIAGTGDFDGDGHIDILWRNTASGLESLWLMNPDLTVKAYVDIGIVSKDWQIVGTGDFDADGHIDILWQNTVDGTVGLWLMNPDLSVKAYLNIGIVSSNWQIAGAGDFDGDGHTDILWRNTATGLESLWLMNPDFSVKAYVDIGIVSQDWQIAR